MRKSTWIWTACSLLAIGVIGTLAGLTSGFSDWSFESRETAETTEPRRLNEVTIDFSNGLTGTYGGSKFDGDVTELNSLTDSDEDVFSGFVWTRTHTKVVYRASDIGSEGASMILGYGEDATYGYIGLELSEGFVFDGCEVVGRSYGGTDGEDFYVDVQDVPVDTSRVVMGYVPFRDFGDIFTDVAISVGKSIWQKILPLAFAVLGIILAIALFPMISAAASASGLAIRRKSEMADRKERDRAQRNEEKKAKKK